MRVTSAKATLSKARALQQDGYKKRLLTKTLLLDGARCKKRAWFQIHKPELGIDSLEFLKHLGNRVAEHVRHACVLDKFPEYNPRLHCPGEEYVVNLANEFEEQSCVEQTMDAVQDPSIRYILEGTFASDRVLVRVDVLKRSVCGERWDLFEVKSSTQLKDVHLLDVAIQKRVIEKTQLVELDKCYVAHINNQFVFDGQSYEGLFEIVEVTDMLPSETQVDAVIAETMPLTDPEAEMPDVPIGTYCNKPSPCRFKPICKPEAIGTPLDTLPRVAQRHLENWKERGFVELTDIPKEEIRTDLGKRIWQCHKDNQNWYSPELRGVLDSLGWPRYFMDFEMVQQGVPVIPGSRPRESQPFQWSVHRWDSLEQSLSLEDAKSFVAFDDPDIRVKFLTSLLDVLGDSGPIFVHSIAAERSVLQSLLEQEDCAHLKHRTEAVIRRLYDTLKLSRNHFYSPKLRGAFGLKRIVNAIPTTVDYTSPTSGAVSSGNDAQMVWFKVTDPSTCPEEKERLIAELVHYCARDTLALVDLMKHFEESV